MATYKEFDITISGITSETFGNWLAYNTRDVLPAIWTIEDEFYAVGTQLDSPDSDFPLFTVAIIISNNLSKILVAWVDILPLDNGVQAIGYSDGNSELIEPVAELILSFFGERAHDNFDPERATVQPTGAAVDGGQAEQAGGDWWIEQVRDVGSDREIIRLWRKGYTASNIARRVGRESKTITKKITELRKKYGAEIVKYRRK